ncbi:MAG: hypothetical protein FWD70_06775 [Desulfuromonadales bacterium]|nr:hypothetical protein [Desulfuromonadales bacterium]
MPWTLKAIFDEYPQVETIEVVGYLNDDYYGLSEDKRTLKIYDSRFAQQLAMLPGAGHTTPEGYFVKGDRVFEKDDYKAYVKRCAPK